jgi:hypothetical protein
VPGVLAIPNSFLLALLEWQEGSKVPQLMRIFDAHPWQAIRLLPGSLLTFT